MDSPREWIDALAVSISGKSMGVLDRVEVLAEVASTQDTAFELARGRPGLLVIALRQTAGRGRLGRTWLAAPDLGLASTFVIDAARFTAAQLSLAMGIAAARTLDGCTPGLPQFGLRWPNDVVEPKLEHEPSAGRKVAGVLIEVRGGLALVGIGINVLQQESDFPSQLRTRAVSLRQLGATASRLDVAKGLVTEVHRQLCDEPESLARQWTARDVLTGTSQAFIHDGRRYAGVVESIDPASTIQLRTGPDSLIGLPASTTSLVKD